MSQEYGIIIRCLRKKYSVANYQYFKNGNTQQCYIFRRIKYNFCLVVLFVKFQLHISNITKVMNLRIMMGQMRLKTVKRQIYTQALLSSKSILPTIPLMVITLVTFDILD